GLYGGGLKDIAGLIGLERAALAKRKPRADLGGGIGNERRRPVFVGEDEPALGVLEVDRLLIFDVGVFFFLHLVGKHAHEAFVADHIAFKLRRAESRDQPEWMQRDRRRGLVHHLVANREHVLVVDRNSTAELQPLTIVVDELQWMIDG